MAQHYKFFNSTHDDPRTYQAGDFAEYFRSVLSAGLLHVNKVPGLKTFVESGALRTYVAPGKAMINGHLYENTGDEYLNHSLPESSADRIDRIVLRLDLRNSERNILLHIKEGDPSSSPVAPTLQRDNFIYELSLAQVRVRANTASLQASDLIDERLDKNLCGLVYSMLGDGALQQEFDNYKASQTKYSQFTRVTNHSIPSGEVTLLGWNSKTDFHGADFCTLSQGIITIKERGIYEIITSLMWERAIASRIYPSDRNSLAGDFTVQGIYMTTSQEYGVGSTLGGRIYQATGSPVDIIVNARTSMIIRQVAKL